MMGDPLQPHLVRDLLVINTSPANGVRVSMRDRLPAYAQCPKRISHCMPSAELVHNQNFDELTKGRTKPSH
jgi:hypothetical protein